MDFSQKTADKKRDRLIVITYDPDKATQDTASEGKRIRPSGASAASGTLFDQAKRPDNPHSQVVRSRPAPDGRTAPDNPPDDPKREAVRLSQRADQRLDAAPDGPDAPDSSMRLPSQVATGEPWPEEPPAWVDELPDADAEPSCAVCGTRMIVIEPGQTMHPNCDANI